MEIYSSDYVTTDSSASKLLYDILVIVMHIVLQQYQ